MDFVKADNCHRPAGYTEQELYRNFSHALNQTGRPILFSLCEWGDANVTTWGGTVAQMWRVQQDHLPFWHFPPKAAGMGLGQGTGDIIEYVASVQPSRYVGPYNWLDPDFLETLFPLTMNYVDSRTEYTFWALWASPLIVATDIRNMSARKREILMNPEVIAVDQDPLGHAGDRRANATSGAQVWSRNLANGDVAIVLYNAHNHNAVPVSFTLEQVGLPAAAVYTVRDLWARTDLPNITTGNYTTATAIKPHDVMFLRLAKVAAALG